MGSRHWKWGSTLLALFATMQVGACNCDDSAGGGGGGGGNTTSNNTSGLPVPTINDLPAVTNKAMLEISGTKGFENGVELMLNDAAWDGIAGPTQQTEWMSEVTLKEGENTLIVRGTDPLKTGGFSAESAPVMVVLDTTPPDAPTLTSTADPCIGTEQFTITGVAEAGSTVAVDGDEVSVEEDGSFSIVVDLREGTNTFNVTATDAAGNEGDALVVTLNKGVTTPTVDPVESPFDGDVQTITGTKGAGTAVAVSLDEESWTTVVQPNNETTFSFDLDLEGGNNTFWVRGENAAGDASCDVVGPFEIFVSDVCRPSVVNGPFTSPTREAQLTVSGEKCPDTGVWLRYADQTLADATEQVALNGSSQFEFEFTLNEGENTFFIHNQDGDGIFSAGDGPFTVVLDTTPPAIPVYDPEPNNQTGDAELTLTGIKEANSNLCLRRDTEPVCTQIEPLSASTDFEFSLLLNPGDNFFCLSSFDAAGNQSDPDGNCVTIRLVEESSVVWLQPLNGTIITQNAFNARVQAQDENGIESVEICFDANCGAASEDGEGRYARMITPGELTNGSVHELVATATNTAGVRGSATIRVVYVVGGLLLSDSIVADSERPVIDVDGDGNLHVVWADNCSQFAECDVETDNNLPYDIFHRQFDGETWSDITNLSINQGDADSRNPAIAADEQGRIHVVWEDAGDILDSGGDFDIFHKIYNPDDGSWTQARLVTSNSATDDTNAQIATGPGAAVAVAWQRRDGGDNDIYISRYTNNSWSAEILITDDANDGDSRGADLAIDNLGNILVTWQDRGDINGSGGDFDIWLRSYSTNGSLGDYILVSDGVGDGASFQPKIVAGTDGFAHIIWRDNTSLLDSGSDLDIFYRRYSAANGLESYRLITAHPNDATSDEANLTINPNTNALYISWTESGDLFSNSGDDGDVYFMEYNQAPGPISLVSSGAFNSVSEWSVMAFDRRTQNLHIVWEDSSVIGNNGDDKDVFYLGVNLAQ